jgi:hypothetical protein
VKFSSSKSSKNSVKIMKGIMKAKNTVADYSGICGDFPCPAHDRPAD